MLMNNIRRRPISFSTGHSATLQDAETGRKFIDFFADVGTASLGYCGREQREVLKRMIADNVPTHAPNLYGFDERSRAGERLARYADMEKVFFCNSGAEAAEAAIKLARLNHAKKGIASIRGGFHGRTYGALAAGDGPPHHYMGFGELPEGFTKFDITEGDGLPKHPETLCAVMLAPVFGNNDIRVYPDLWLESLRKFCDDNELYLIFDEVQSGSGRSGAPTYGQRIGVRPDILCLGKGVAMGAPVGACLSKGLDFSPGSHFSTFGGNPLSAAFVNGMLDYLSGDEYHTAMERADVLRAHFQNRHWAKNVRGVGALIAFDFERDTLQLSEACMDEGLLIGAFRSGPGPVKITPPLNISMDEIEAGMIAIDKAVKHV